MGRKGNRSRGKQGDSVLLRDLGNNVYKEPTRQMKENQLPLWKDVGLHMSYLEKSLCQEEVVSKTVEKVEFIYKSASIPTIPSLSIRRKIHRLLHLKRAQEMLKNKDQGKQKKKKKNHRPKEKISDVLEKLFEVKSEVPELEAEFYEDQCNERKMYIGSIDKEETRKRIGLMQKLQKKDDRKSKEEDKMKEQRKKATIDAKRYEKVSWKEMDDDKEESELYDGEVDDDTEFRAGEKFLKGKGRGHHEWETKGSKKRRRMSGEDKLKLEDFMTTCDRFNVSETASSTLFNLQNSQAKINQSQINKKKKELRLKTVKHFTTDQIPEAIGFDERKDMTKVQVGLGIKGKKRYEIMKEEHCAVIVYPGDQFAGHLTPKDGTGAGLAKDLEVFLKNRNIDMKQVKHLVSDGCEKMVGWKSGVHAIMEQIYQRPFGRIICVFHHLEKSFGVVLILYSGHTTSPGTYSGGVGKEVKEDVHKLPVKNFKTLPNPSLLLLIEGISDKTFRNLSNDHKIFIGLVKIVITGVVDERWVNMKIGPVVTSRFTTTQARCIKKYISEETPSFELRRVVNYLIYVWAEVFLMAKHRNLFVEAPRVLLLEVMLTKQRCSAPERMLLEKSMSFNGQMAHHESILLAMLASPHTEERKLAVEVIFRIREEGPKEWSSSSGIRPFKVGRHIQIKIKKIFPNT